MSDDDDYSDEFTEEIIEEDNKSSNYNEATFQEETIDDDLNSNKSKKILQNSDNLSSHPSEFSQPDNHQELQKAFTCKDSVRILRELRILRTLREHPNIVSCVLLGKVVIFNHFNRKG